MEFNVEQGVGYQTAAQQDSASSPPAGVLPVDAVFSPVRKVNYNVERTRVGQVTDYERLVMEVWTDGTINAVDAIQQAAENLVNHFFLFSNLNKAVQGDSGAPVTVVSPEIYQTPIEKLELSPRTLNCLKRSHISKVGEVLEMSDEELLKIRNFGDKSLDELKEKLAEHGITTMPGRAAGIVGEISPDDLGELMGGGEVASDSPVEVPGMSIEDMDDDGQNDTLDEDTDDLDEDEDKG
jgi:DNA-directed RNA polymerase subunit alpha